MLTYMWNLKFIIGNIELLESCRFLYIEIPNGVWRPKLVSTALQIADQMDQCNFGDRTRENFGDDYAAIIIVASRQVRQLHINVDDIRSRVFREATFYMFQLQIMNLAFNFSFEFSIQFNIVCRQTQPMYSL